MKAHRQKPDSAAALIEMATRVYGRIARAAPYATAANRLRLMGELALLDQVLDTVEHAARIAAQKTLTALPRPRGSV